LWRAGAEVTQHPQFARAVGEDAVRRLNGSPVAALLRSLGSPEHVYRQIATTATKYSTAATLRAVAGGPGFAEIVAVAAPGFPRDPNHCAWTCGCVSVGRSTYPQDADDADGLLRQADAAMFAVKRGRQTSLRSDTAAVAAGP
jgi:hypothetical protein